MEMSEARMFVRCFSTNIDVEILGREFSPTIIPYIVWRTYEKNRVPRHLRYRGSIPRFKSHQRTAGGVNLTSIGHSVKQVMHNP